ncbi:cbb3-type cytochrome c oxidase subunit 3 [Porphyrobacter sp. CACIAM 03H1]|uniref:cbb3-type cytochrome c oxidase subunit 3 n=1 Tax=Porphyrobacter sp. CACIAM 03H1 TaxID=2003315 RepID=UPI000B5A78D6|nr:cbb3-type cytochrome c oxidase subunit 3 [Porphyrobacter sp. CACIAM 03H1]ASJ90537.1 CcoQ/FixQ family Cbb3-type cytochrome c oxidase assembly chaperone [Porphyrobacter sp. CACIAM 03H1]
MSLYTALRHFADSYALAGICALYLTLCLWHFRPAARRYVADAKHSIFRDDDHDQQ